MLSGDFSVNHQSLNKSGLPQKMLHPASVSKPQVLNVDAICLPQHWRILGKPLLFLLTTHTTDRSGPIPGQPGPKGERGDYSSNNRNIIRQSRYPQAPWHRTAADIRRYLLLAVVDLGGSTAVALSVRLLLVKFRRYNQISRSFRPLKGLLSQ